MSVNIDDIRNGLVTNLASITGCQKLPYRNTNPTPPSLLVVGFDQIQRTAFGAYVVPMLVQGIAGAPTDKSAQQRLDRWLSPVGDENVWAALESDSTLGGIVDDVTVTGCDGTQPFVLDNGTEVLGSTWHVQIDL